VASTVVYYSVMVILTAGTIGHYTVDMYDNSSPQLYHINMLLQEVQAHNTYQWQSSPDNSTMDKYRRSNNCRICDLGYYNKHILPPSGDKRNLRNGTALRTDNCLRKPHSRLHYRQHKLYVIILYCCINELTVKPRWPGRLY